MKVNKNIYVYENWSDHPVLIGVLREEGQGNEDMFSFEYDEKWLNNWDLTFFMDPDLELFQGRQFSSLDQGLFGMFSDSSPDRWGRSLMNQREVIKARAENRRPKALREIDYLLGVYDQARMGALRFATSQDGNFCSQENNMEIPPWASLKKLEKASRAFEKDIYSLDDKWLNQLIGSGAALGGDRPKATVKAPDGSLWIAKFPSDDDQWNSGGWEKVVNDLAEMCGLNVPESRLERLSISGSTFLVKRFDRQGKKRLHFASAMTLLGKTKEDKRSSYLDLVSFIKAKGAKPKEDLLELWRRVVFNILVSNTDDNLKNHGFILTPNGWRLAPFYDINPTIFGDSLSLNITEFDGTMDMELALETSRYYGIRKDQGEKIIKEMEEIVSDYWQQFAQKHKINRRQIEYMMPAFTVK
ncbi:MAG: type II toxin-antitoxin system HipA family toxin [Anaerovoracaceae bacterium]